MGKKGRADGGMATVCYLEAEVEQAEIPFLLVYTLRSACCGLVKLMREMSFCRSGPGDECEQAKWKEQEE